MNFDAAIFDLDGTLLDTVPTWNRILAAPLNRRGLPCPDGYAEKVHSLSFHEAAEYTVARFSLGEPPEALLDEWDRLAVSILWHTLNAYRVQRSKLDQPQRQPLHRSVIGTLRCARTGRLKLYCQLVKAHALAQRCHTSAGHTYGTAFFQQRLLQEAQLRERLSPSLPTPRPAARSHSPRYSSPRRRFQEM